jgi:4-hydroxy-tetrahydrodipicolinate synthase
MVAPVPGLATDEQVLAYFRSVAEGLREIPAVVQNYPPANGVFMSVSLMNRLFREFRGFKMLKHEEAPGLRKLSQLRASDGERGGRRISIIAGNGAIHLPQELRRGADGVMTGFAFPEMLTGVCRRFAGGDIEGAEDLYDAYLPLVRHEQQAGIGLAVRKEILRRRGLIRSAQVRAPGPALDPDDHEELTQLLKRTDRALQKLGARLPALQER